MTKKKNEEHDPETGEINEAASPEYMSAETLAGDIRDVILREFKALPKPWPAMSEDEQSRAIHRATDIANDLVRRSIDQIAARGLPSLAITVGKFTCEGAEVKGVFTTYASDENLIGIRHLAERRAVFVLADPALFEGERAPAEPDNVGDLAMPKETEASVASEAAIAKVGRGRGTQNGAHA